ncbi:MAG TPA: SseB family protein [Candidatus Mediterraneibacter faecigallinarum]|jgi:hypothetical protein|uniref:SseB family protein n=1 Tax=Candidatus Mediterraneibacter faecigallinarum TaxID=2838669 RepID=A0A9D2NW77_9FIRM|nr:SseB family protein [Candidatus Mediterraneibacter faecigallinarum]
MDEKKNTTVTKQETLQALRNPGEIYAVMSGATRMPFVVCDEETYDDEVFLYYRLEDAQEKAKKLAEERYQTAVAKIEEKQLLGFYTNLFTMGVNCLAVNEGTDMAIRIQLSELVARKKPENLPEGQKLVENPALHLTALYFMQEMRRMAGAEPTEEVKALQEELLAHYNKGTYIIAVEEDGKIPILKQKDGSIYQPVFTDMLECQKFCRGKKMKVLAIPAAKIAEILVPDAKGVAVNPFGVNVQLQVVRPQKKETSPTA